MSKKSTWYAVFAIIIVAAFVYALSMKNSAPTADALSYQIDEQTPVEVAVATADFDYTAGQLLAMAQECGSQKDLDYFTELTDTFSNTQKQVYTFTYTEMAQSPLDYVVTVMPNAANYQTLDEFKADFDTCAAGGQAYPAEVTANSLMFVSACGTGFDDGSGNPVGCSQVIDAVNLNLN